MLVFVESYGAIIKDKECMRHDCFQGGLSVYFVVITRFSFAILYIITSQAALRPSSSSVITCR